jgi:hypothetical protein
MAAFTTIDDPSAYFKVQLYTGNGSANHAITFDDTDTDMQPDLVIIRQRPDTVPGICWFDSVRGATKLILSNTDAAETTDTDTLDSFTSDGFQVDADTKVNDNTKTYASWNWKAGTTSGINATGAEITPSAYSFNQTSGFSILKYAGEDSPTQPNDLAHGLAAVPHFMVFHNLTNGYAWQVYHHKNTAAPETDTLVLNTNAATDDTISRWYDTVPTSVLVTLGESAGVNDDSSVNFIAYCWTEKQGFSKFGGYEGNNNADGTFVYTGFRPAFVLSKSIDSTHDWQLWDNKRSGYNQDNDLVVWNEVDAEDTSTFVDLLSNGFKWRTTTPAGPNVSETFIYAAFAEAPFVNSNGVPCNAR